MCIGDAKLYVSLHLLAAHTNAYTGNPKEWRRHLDGCAYLIQAAGINGFSGKEEQALFWCFARMGISLFLPRNPCLIILPADMCGGLISEEETIIPICNWTPKGMSPTEVASLVFASKSSFDTYANYTVYLVAQTLGLLFGCTPNKSRPGVSCQYLAMNGDNCGGSDVCCWRRLFDRVEQWFENRPSQMKPIFTIGTTGYSERPFPTVLYGNGAASRPRITMRVSD